MPESTDSGHSQAAGAMDWLRNYRPAPGFEDESFAPDTEGTFMEPYEVTIAEESRFVYDDRFAKGNSLVFRLVGDGTRGGKSLWDEPRFYPVNPAYLASKGARGFEPSEDGLTISHPAGRGELYRETDYYVLIAHLMDREHGLVAHSPEAKAELARRVASGITAKDARLFHGLRLLQKPVKWDEYEDKRERDDQGNSVKKAKYADVPIAFLGVEAGSADRGSRPRGQRAQPENNGKAPEEVMAEIAQSATDFNDFANQVLGADRKITFQDAKRFWDTVKAGA